MQGQNLGLCFTRQQMESDEIAETVRLVGMSLQPQDNVFKGKLQSKVKVQLESSGGPGLSPAWSGSTVFIDKASADTWAEISAGKAHWLQVEVGSGSVPEVVLELLDQSELSGKAWSQNLQAL